LLKLESWAEEEDYVKKTSWILCRMAFG